MTKTPEQIAALKRQWSADPCWDIETTEGFEAHVDELRAYRLEREAEQERLHRAMVSAKAAELDCSQATAEVIVKMDQQIKRLTVAVTEQHDRIADLERAGRRAANRLSCYENGIIPD